MTQLVNSPTHDKGEMLDLLITKRESSSLIIDLKVAPVCYSDHSLITLRLCRQRQRPVTRLSEFRRLKNINNEDLGHDLRTVRDVFEAWSDLDCETMATELDSKLRQILEKHAPLISRPVRVGEFKPILSTQAKTTKLSCRRAERYFLKDRSSVNRAILKRERAKLKREIISSRASQIREELTRDSQCPKARWKNLNRLLHRGTRQLPTDDESIKLADDFSTHFRQKIRDIHNSTGCSQSQSTDPPRPYNGPSMFSLDPTTPDEVLLIIKALPNKTSPQDPFPVPLIKLHSVIFSQILAKLINLSYAEGRFPSIYKMAQVLPLLKKNGLDPTVPNNYRPISNLTTFSKILERVTLRRICPHLQHSDNFPVFQSAYRSHHSTETALLHVLACAAPTIRGFCTLLISLDMTAAFDTVVHQILISRLRAEFGIEGTALSWLDSYLSSRSQFVKLGRHASPIVTLDIGVPQGSVLGPLLFTVYISPISSIVSNYTCTYHQYADDLSIQYPIDTRDPARSIRDLEKCLSELTSWHSRNGLQLNPTKFEILPVGTPQSLTSLGLDQIHLNGVEYPFADTIKLLGVPIDRQLSMISFVSNTVKSCRYHLWAIRHVRQYLNETEATELIRCLVLSRLDYCNSTLANVSASTMKRLQSIQTRAVRLINKSKTQASLHWLPVQYRCSYKVALLTFKAINGTGPQYLNAQITRRQHDRNLRGSSVGFLHQPVPSNKLHGMTFPCVSPMVWNSLPGQLRSTSSLELFRKILKTHYFKMYIDSVPNS